MKSQCHCRLYTRFTLIELLGKWRAFRPFTLIELLVRVTGSVKAISIGVHFVLSRLRRTVSQSSARSFTLIELLVVIAIIAILASLLLPALARGREEAKKIACMGNVNQINTGLLMYQDDFNQRLPHAQYDLGFGTMAHQIRRWYHLIRREGYAGDVNSWAVNDDAPPGIWRCPGETGKETTSMPLHNGWRGSHYGLNRAAFHRQSPNYPGVFDSKTYSGSTKRIRLPDELYMVAAVGVDNHLTLGDGWSTSPGSFNYHSGFLPHAMNRLMPYWRHRHRLPVGFLDGHVEVLNEQSYETSPTAYGQHFHVLDGADCIDNCTENAFNE